jgi:superfamily II DNA or RNA helicase
MAVAYSRHPRRSALPAGLFQNLTSFRELEGRIAMLTEELHRGDAFEVFVEAYLQTHSLFQVEDLWLVGQVPAEVRRLLNLPRDHKGIDGVFRTRSGELVPYQVKFRIARPQVTVREVSTFLGLTERARDRMLISNSDRYAGDIENRDGLRILAGTYFDSLTCDELNAIADWLQGRPFRPAPAAPRPHQQVAIEEVTNVLASEDRATAVMASGAGKTLVGLRVAEALEPQAVLVLVPSLALLNQSLMDWSRDTNWGERFEYLCVCSDASVTQSNDEWLLRASETPFPVQTKPEVVRDFLERPARGKVRVVFTTYHSAPIVGKGLPPRKRFDIGIFDEAHKTVGAQGETFAFALDDKRLRIQKRLFLTATPRTIDVRHKDRQGEFRVVSMDDPAIYGRRAHELSFADAVAQGIICDYHVVVSTVEPEEIPKFALKRGITLVNGDQQATRWVATQIAVAKAIQVAGAKKVITFHSRVEQAKQFASDSARGIGHFLPDFKVGHVNGADPVAVRKGTLAGFRETQKLLVTNARCLTEGVDLPAVDMVVFTNPRKSKVDIVQAVGRAMRKPSEGSKTHGYVVVPILLSPRDADDAQAACQRTDWEDTVDVLAALRDYDTRLDELIRDQQCAIGRGKTFSPRSFSDQITVLGPRVRLAALRQHIAAVILSRLGAPWDERYGELQTFHARYGHANVPRDYGDNPRLAYWVLNQRQARKRGKLAEERVARLDALGFWWNPYAAEWEEKYSELAQFQAAQGHCNVRREDRVNRQLATWVSEQRMLWRERRLSQEKIKRLEALGFAWDPIAAFWADRLRELKVFHAMNGHCNVPSRYEASPRLGQWLSGQRHAWRKGRLTLEQTRQLDALGVRPEGRRDSSWEKQFAALSEYRRRHGHCDVPQLYPEDRELGTWLAVQRRAKAVGRLSAQRVARLEAIGVVWNAIDAAWEEKFAALEAFKAREGHCNVLQKYPDDVELGRLGKWLTKQRVAKKRNTLSDQRAASLESIGVAWEPREALWEQRYTELLAFHQSEGHCNVPDNWPPNTSLGTWVGVQRRAYKKQILAREKVARLESLGFAWDPISITWDQKCQELRRFKLTHGHCNVPQAYVDNPGLGVWLNKQRQKKRKGELPAAREKMLESIGVIWEPKKGPLATSD